MAARLKEMRERISAMRDALYNGLTALNVPHDLSFLKEQTGLFSFLGLSLAQVMRIRDDYGVYLPDDGRANIAGLNKNNIEYVINAIAAVLKNVHDA